MEEELKALKQEVQRASKIAKNAVKLSVIIGFVAVFFVILNLAVLLSSVSGMAGLDRKVNSFINKHQEQKDNSQINSKI